jgi:hypothetical protein
MHKAMGSAHTQHHGTAPGKVSDTDLYKPQLLGNVLIQGLQLGGLSQVRQRGIEAATRLVGQRTAEQGLHVGSVDKQRAGAELNRVVVSIQAEVRLHRHPRTKTRASHSSQYGGMLLHGWNW